MKQIKKDTICYYCLGCNKLENENFYGVMNCKNVIYGIENWQEKIRKEFIKNESRFKRHKGV